MAGRLWRSAVVRLKANVFHSSEKLILNALPNSFVNFNSRRLNAATGSGINLWEEYRLLKEATDGKTLPLSKDPWAVFANNEMNLREIDVYGFDYDYTIAVYRKNLNRLIYDLGREMLVSHLKYPKDIILPEYEYDPRFAVRGLHCDIQKGILLKIDAFHNIQMGTVYRGLHPVPDNEVREMYHGSHVDIESLGGFYGVGPKMYQFMDLFALPEMTLYANVIEFFIKHDITYDPEYVFFDIRNTIASLHGSGVIHRAIEDNLDSYLIHQPEISDLFRRLSAAGKKLFVITNSGFHFVDKGMCSLIGPEWTGLFDVIITNARKPKFFSESSRHFRQYDPNLGVKTWNKVERLSKGCVYQEGNFKELIKLTDWSGSRVLYVGDHVYTDLADVSLKLGWRTGAIIPELEDEIHTINSVEFKRSIVWLTALEVLIDQMQVYEDAESQKVLSEWLAERDSLRKVTKAVFNAQFGSIFRTYHNSSYFSRRFKRFADIYMSSIVNLLKYSVNHTFYPCRSALPHELSFGNVVQRCPDETHHSKQS